MFVFAAYASSAPAVSSIFEHVSDSMKGTPFSFHIWPENDVVGRPLIEPILENIDKSDFVVCDITKLNFNVVFEAGYAVSKNKRVLFLLNSSVDNDSRLFSQIGIFDTIGYSKYENSGEFSKLISEFDVGNPLYIEYAKDMKNPVFILELPKKTDVQTRLESRIKRARLRYRSFNAQEHVRLSGLSAIEGVAAASGVIVPLAPSHMQNENIHNIRAAFIAGLAYGMDRPLLMLQEIDGPAPLDVRDFVKTFRELDGVNSYVADFANLVVEEMQAFKVEVAGDHPPLADLMLGDPMAENEMTTLASYYLTTDEFLRVSRGEANVVVGRKGMGKTALFIRLRDKIRRDRRNIVVDLKPEGYQLKKLREDVLNILSEASVDHLIIAFWEYLLYAEICNKLIEKDSQRHLYDHSIRDIYEKLLSIKGKVSIAEEGDFSERLYSLVGDVIDSIKSFKFSGENARLSTENVTEIIHSYHLPELRNAVIEYLQKKESLWILFDNLDKGWPTKGISDSDAVILRSLIDASKKIKRELNRSDVEAHAVVFVRNDVYEILIENSSDFGKELRAQLDWSDIDQLKRLVSLRLSDSRAASFEEVWEKYFSRLVDGEYSFDYIVDRSLMRPRNIIKIMYYSRGFAVNSRGSFISEHDIKKALYVYSNDVLEEADEEISDIEPAARGLLYNFIGERPTFGLEELRGIIRSHLGGGNDISDRIIEYLLYYGFFGVRIPDSDQRYIYNYQYNMKLMTSWINKNRNRMVYYLNPAFWPALETV